MIVLYIILLILFVPIWVGFTTFLFKAMLEWTQDSENFPESLRFPVYMGLAFSLFIAGALGLLAGSEVLIALISRGQ